MGMVIEFHAYPMAPTNLQVYFLFWNTEAHKLVSGFIFPNFSTSNISNKPSTSEPLVIYSFEFSFCSHKQKKKKKEYWHVCANLDF